MTAAIEKHEEWVKGETLAETIVSEQLSKEERELELAVGDTSIHGLRIQVERIVRG